MIVKGYLARRIFSPVLGVFVFCVVVVAIFYLAQILGFASNDSWPLDAVLRMAALRLVLYFDVLIPVAVLIGMVIGLGRVSQTHELTALANAGVSKAQFFRLIAWPILALCLGVLLLSTVFRPWGYSHFYAVEASLAARLDMTRIEPGRFQVGDDEWLIYADRKEDGVLHDVFVHQLKPTGRGLLTAKRLVQTVDDDGVMRLRFDGQVSSYTLPADGAGSRRLVSEFESLDVLVEAKEAATREKIRRALPLGKLIASSRPIEVAEWQWRLVTPLSVLLLAWSASLLGSNRPRTHRGIFIFVALGVATLYFSAVGVLVNWVEQARLPAWPGVFLAPLSLAVLLALLTLGQSRWRIMR